MELWCAGLLCHHHRAIKLFSSIVLCIRFLFHWTLDFRRSSKVIHMCAVLYASSPHSHVVSPLKYPHFFLCSLLQVYPVRSLFRHRHLSQGLSYPLAGSSFRLTMSNNDLDLLCHSLWLLQGNTMAFGVLWNSLFQREMAIHLCRYRRTYTINIYIHVYIYIFLSRNKINTFYFPLF